MTEVMDDEPSLKDIFTQIISIKEDIGGLEVAMNHRLRLMGEDLAALTERVVDIEDQQNTAELMRSFEGVAAARSRGTYMPDDPENTGQRGRMRKNGISATDRDWVRAPYNYG